MKTKAPHVIVVLAAVLWSGSMVQGGFGQSQTAPQGWRHFGSSDSVPPSNSGGWHYFGAANTRPKVTAGDRKTYPTPHSSSITALEHEMSDLINRDRLDPANAAETSGRARPLLWNERLAAVARQHSRDMLEQKFFAHVDREGRSPAARVSAAGIGWQSVGENIAVYEAIPGAESAFMNEPRFAHNHRSNILDSKYTDVGVGIVEGPDGRYYITQEFVATP